MRRKLIRQKTAYTITLPIKWIRDHKLNSADELDVEERSEGLIITTEKRVSADKASVHLDNSDPDYCRIIVENHYLKGYSELNVTYEHNQVLPVIQQIVSNLIGFEVVEQREKGCIIKATAEPCPEEFTRLLNRSFNIILYTQELIKEDLHKRVFDSKDDIDAYTKDTRRFLLFCTRTLHLGSITSRVDESFMHLVLERLILVQHDHAYLYGKLASMKQKAIRGNVVAFYLKACNLFGLYAKMFAKNDTKNFSIINVEWKDMYFREGHELFNKCTKAESVIIYHSLHLAKLVWLISQPNLVSIRPHKHS